MWTLDEADDNDCRVLQHTDGTAINLMLADQFAARDAATRADMERVFEAVFGRSRKTVPSFSDDDLDRIREVLGGAVFQQPPTFKPVT